MVSPMAIALQSHNEEKRSFLSVSMTFSSRGKVI
jgi:hypothetical protein